MTAHVDDGVGPLAVGCFIVNACMGMGFLAIPYSSQQLGLVFAFGVTASICTIAILSAIWSATVLSLISALVRADDPHLSPEIRSCEPLVESLKRPRSPGSVEAPVATYRTGNFDITEARLSYTSMIGALYGPYAERTVAASICLYFMGGLWGFAALVAGSLTTIVPSPFVGGTCDIYTQWSEVHCAQRYYGFLFIFAVIAVTLSLMHLKEQKGFQIGMTLVRLLLVALMLGDCIRMLVLHEAPSVPGGFEGAHAAPLGSTGHGPLYNPKQFPDVQPPHHMNLAHLGNHIAMVTFAITVHVVIPEATHDLRDKPRNLIPTITVALLFCAVVYILMGLIVPMTFGNWVQPVNSLNWANYTGGQVEASVAAIIFRSFIILVPVVDITAAYPILVISLASNIHSIVRGAGLADKDDKAPPPWWLRALCAILPVLGAALVFDVTTALGWTGFFLLPVLFIIMPLLLLRAQSLCMARFGKEAMQNSVYWRWYCNQHILWMVLFLGVAFSLAAAF